MVQFIYYMYHQAVEGCDNMYTEVFWIVIKSDVSLKYLTSETLVEILSIGSDTFICLGNSLRNTN